MFEYMLYFSFLGYLFISLIVVSYLWCFLFLLLYLLTKFRLNYRNEINQHKWLIIVVYFVNTFHCTNFIFLHEIFEEFQLTFSFFHENVDGTHSHGSAKQWSHNSMFIHKYILTSTKRYFWGTLCSYDEIFVNVI